MIKPGDLVRINSSNSEYFEIYKVLATETTIYLKLKYFVDDYSNMGRVYIDKSHIVKLQYGYNAQIHKLPDHQIELMKEYFLDLFYNDNPHEECYIDFNKWNK